MSCFRLGLWGFCYASVGSCSCLGYAIADSSLPPYRFLSKFILLLSSLNKGCDRWVKSNGEFCPRHSIRNVHEGKEMEFISDIASGLGSVNWEVIAQLTFVALIMLSGPIVIFLLAAQRGNL
nr:photosystem II reaction center protein Ycf12 [Microcoleus sp. FACHB-831]